MERKEKLIRVLQILEQTDINTPLNSAQLLNKLENDYNVGIVNRKSIYQDIKLLQSCGYNIIQARDKKRGWYIGNHTFDDWEIKIMMDAIQQARCISVDEATEIRNRLLKLTSSRGRSRFSHMMLPEAGNVQVYEKIGQYIETMIEAMFMRKKIEFQYTEVNDELKKVLRRNGDKYVLNLYEIYWSENNYYLIGSHDNHEGLTNYRLDRVVNLSMTNEHAVDAKVKIGENPELKIQKYIRESVDHFNGDTIRVEVEYEPNQTTNAILYDFAGKDIKVKKLENGKCMATFYKMNSVTLERWFLQFVGMFTVLGPDRLKSEIRNRLNKAINDYNK